MPRTSIRTPGRPPAKLDRDARDLLLAAATDLFAQHGVAATTFAMIAKRAGLTPAMVHYYFTGREQLLDAVVEVRIAPLIASVWNPLEAGAAPAEMIRGVVERMLAGIAAMPWIPSTWMREVLNEGGLLRTRMLRHLPFDKVKILASAIARGQASYAVNPDLDPGMIVFSVIGLVMMHMATMRFWAEVFGRKVPSEDAMRQHITGLLLHGLEPASPAQQAKRSGNK
ncbi:MAG: TetR/AcrR family transcriptional regulator [Acidobacteriaceae bacterium]